MERESNGEVAVETSGRWATRRICCRNERKEEEKEREVEEFEDVHICSKRIESKDGKDLYKF